MDYVFFNLSALLFGIAAWGLPALALGIAGKRKGAAAALIFGGLVCAVLSLLSVIVYNTYLVAIGDWSALLDTANAFQFVSLTMALIAIALATVAIYVNARHDCTRRERS